MAGLAILGQSLLVLSAWLLPIFSEFHLTDDTIAELTGGRFGWLQTLGFLLAGSTAIVFAFAIRQVTTGDRGSISGSWLIGIFGLCGVAAALFPSDVLDGPIDLASLSTSGTIHLAAVSIGVLAMVLAMFTFSFLFARDWRWRSLTRYSVLLSASALALLFAQTQGPIVGLMQRGLVTVIAGWVVMAAFHLRRVAEVMDLAAIRSLSLRSSSSDEVDSARFSEFASR